VARQHRISPFFKVSAPSAATVRRVGGRGEGVDIRATHTTKGRLTGTRTHTTKHMVNFLNAVLVTFLTYLIPFILRALIGVAKIGWKHGKFIVGEAR